MALNVKYVSGGSAVQTVPYTPSGAVAPGEVVVEGELPLICHRPIAANQLGEMSAGGGVYECTFATSANPGARLYWVAASNKVSTNAASGANKPFGFAVGTSAGDNSKALVLHRPGV